MNLENDWFVMEQQIVVKECTSCRFRNMKWERGTQSVGYGTTDDGWWTRFVGSGTPDSQEHDLLVLEQQTGVVGSGTPVVGSRTWLDSQELELRDQKYELKA
jgi:hypothetical protein